MRFNLSNFAAVTQDGAAIDIFASTFKNLKQRIPTTRKVVVTSPMEANLPAIANSYLGDQSLWWVILFYNNTLHPFDDVRPGTVLNIPDRRDLLAALNFSTQDGTVVTLG